jgi:CDP-glycerol glycerophosphotransferase (TagB/SpsB family)
MRVSQPELYARILATPGVEIDTARTPSDAMSRADILLSDISGIAHEFAFIYERPVVVIDRHLEPGGLEGELLGGESEVKQRCGDFIVSLPGARIAEVSEELARVLAAHSPQRLRQVRDEIVYNFGRASEVASRQLMDIFHREKAESGSRQARALPAQESA